MAKLYALLVGINEYPSETGVKPLKGCVNDVDAMQEYLNEEFEHLKPNVKRLVDQDATRENLIKAFQDHLGNADEDDIALFYYSGHGSYENTSEEFETYDSKNQNETLVCYDSRLRGHFDLADKEIAVLLSRLSPNAQKVLILDSCHSGSITRGDDDEVTRQEPAREQAGGVYRRPLETYLLENDNYYLNQKAQGQIKIPITPHLLMSACSRDEKALERVPENSDKRRGLFSTHLLEVLRANDSNISYNDLYLQTRISVIKDRKKQTPTLDPQFGFNANLGFLSDTPVNPRRYPVLWDRGLQLQLGQTHGLPSNSDDIAEISVRIFPKGEEGHPGLPASITEIKATESQLLAEDADPGVTYEAEIVGLPKSMIRLIGLEGPTDKVSAIQEIVSKAPSPHLQFIEGTDGVDYSLDYSVDENDLMLLRIIHVSSGMIVQGAKSKDDLEACINILMPVLEQIEKWERYKAIEKRAERIDENKIDIKLELRQEDGQMHAIPKNQTEVTIDLNKASNGEDWEEVDFRLSINNRTGSDLYILLLGMSRSFGISSYYNEQVVSGAGEVELLADVFSLAASLDKEVDVLKFFVSTEKINAGSYTEDPLELGHIEQIMRGIGSQRAIGSNKASKKEDWFTKTLTITVSGNQKTLGQEASSINGLTFQKNDNLSAKLSFGSINTHTRSADPIYRLPSELENSDFEIINFASTAQEADKCVIELHDIKGEDKLVQQPLEIELDEEMQEGEMIIPVTFDGEFILPFGEVKPSTNNKPLVTIDHLPAQVDDGRRSVGRALKFVLLKTFFDDKFDLFKLRWVDYTAKKKRRLKTDGLKEQIEGANKILLLIHGIIGNTKFMAEEAEFAVVDKGYDLVLTYDYENLDTDINVIAEKLDKDLQAVGLGAGHAKELTIVAHSMGGLVSRHMIENLRNDDGSVNKLLMFGTPNGGSRFGLAPGLIDEKVPEKYKELVKEKAKEWFKFATGFALNLLPGYVKTILEYVVKLAKLDEVESPEVLNTLAMMSPDDDFIKGLVANTKASKTEYFIIAGDVTNYQPSGGWFKRLVEKIEVGVGKVVYYQVPNDIAVGVEDIRKVQGVDPDTHTAVIPGHHLNYFDNPPSVEKWKEWL